MEEQSESAGVSRSQNQLHVAPEDWRTAATIIEPWLDRLGRDDAESQLLVLTSDAEAAAGIALRLSSAEAGLTVLAATDARRAARSLRRSPAQVVVAPARVIVELLQSAAIKLDKVRIVVLAWLDDANAAATRSLETLMAEAPKDAARVVIAGAVTPVVEQLVERYARRARRVEAAAREEEPVPISYVTSSLEGRPSALRRTLDVVDPESAFIVTRTAESKNEVETLLRSQGYVGASSPVRTGEALDGSAEVVVIYDLPANAAELRRTIGAAGRTIALVAPRQIAALRRLAGGSPSPLSLPEAAARARSREDALRDELRAVLVTGQYSRELLALEPLLSEFDGAEIAAAALRLVEAERARPQSVGSSAPPAVTRLYINVGETDNVRAGDLVGAITNEAGIAKTDLGRIDVRDRHSTVEVSTAVANSVVSKLTGTQIRGRRVIARVDEERPRSDRPRRDDGGGRPRRDDGGRGGRGPRDRGGRDRDMRPRRTKAE